MGSVEEGHCRPEAGLVEGEQPRHDLGLGEEQPPSFEDMGIPLMSQTVTTPLGKIRSLANLDRLEYVFLTASLLAVLTTVGLGIARLASPQLHPDDRVFVYLLFLTAGFSLVYAVNGVLREQVYELLVYALTAVVLTLYALFNYLDPETPRGAIKLARLVVACALSLPLVVIAVTLAARYWQRGELVFRTVGANVALQTACRRVLTAQSLLKLDAQLALSSVLLVLHDTSGNGGSGGITAAEAAVLAAGVLITVLWWLAGYAVLRYEARRLLLYLLVPTAVLEPTYIIWKLATEHRAAGVLLECEWAAAVLALLIRVLLVMCLLSCLPGFGLGVSQYMYPDRQAAAVAGERRPRYESFGTGDTPAPSQPSAEVD